MDRPSATGLLVALLVGAALLVGPGSVLLGHPVGLGYVETGSMAPTLDPGDGFVAVPSVLIDVEPGDVVVFRAEEVQGGGLVTHRVVGETNEGFVTQGDANTFTDQSDGEPPVAEPRVVAEALRLDGHVVVVPGLGVLGEVVRSAVFTAQTRFTSTLGLGTQSLAVGLFIAVVVAVGAAEWEERRRESDRTRARSSVRTETGIDPRSVVAGLVVLLVVVATLSMAVPAGPQEFGIVSSSFDSPRADVTPAGESAARSLSLSNGGFVPVVAILEPGSEAVTLERETVVLAPHTATTETVTISTPLDTGYYRYYITEHRYLAVLPTSTIRTLYGMHPWLPVVVIDLMIAGAFLALTLPFVGSGRLRDRSRDGASRSILTRLVR